MLEDRTAPSISGIGTFSPDTLNWALRESATPGTANAATFQYGGGTVPVVGDWNGDGKDGIGVYNPGTSRWSLRQTATAGPADAGGFKFGTRGLLPAVGDWNGDGRDGIGTFNKREAVWTLKQEATAGVADVGTFVFGTKNMIPIIGAFADPVTTQNALVTVTLKPLDIDLLGLKIQSSPIAATVSADPGDGKLLGNALSVVDSIVDLDPINAALNSVLGTVVDLLNSANLQVNGQSAPSTVTAAQTPVLSLDLAPVHLNVLGASVDTSPIRLMISAQSGQGLILGTVLTELTNLLNPPLPERLDLAYLNSRLEQLLANLRQQLPGIAPTDSPAPVLGDG